LLGRVVGGPNSEEETDTLVLYILSLYGKLHLASEIDGDMRYYIIEEGRAASKSPH
jgi:hypothetical protein